MTHSLPINSHLARTNPAPISASKAWSKDYDGTYGEELVLTHGVPSVPPNAAFLERLVHEAGKPENTGYGALSGDDDLREALAREISETYATGHVAIESIAITAGCNMAAQVVIQALAQQGDEIIVPCPWYFNHEMCLDMLGITAVPLTCRHDAAQGGFIPSVEKAELLINDKTRAIILVTPNNPTGSIYSPSVVEAFFDLCSKHSIALIVDETYRDFLSEDQTPPHNLFGKPNWSKTLISLNSFSKSYAIPGWRVGAIIGDATLLKDEISKVLDTMLICPVVSAQKALAWAIHEPEQKKWRGDRCKELENRRQLFSQVINAANQQIAADRGGDSWHGYNVDGLGAYYAFLSNPYVSEGLNSEEFAKALAKETGATVLPASAFGEGVELDRDSNTRRVSHDPKSSHVRVSVANVADEGIRSLENRLVAFDRYLQESRRK